MITSLRLVNFKNFADETLRMGPFTVIVGANASGKSNIRDAFRFLHGIGRGYTLAEIIGGKYGVGGYVQWTGIRGAMDEIIRLGHEGFSVTVGAKVGDRSLSYRIEAEYDDFRSRAFKVTHEELKDGTKTVYSGRGRLDTVWVKTAEYLDKADSVGQPFKAEQPALLQETAMLGEESLINDEPVREIRSMLAGIRFLDLVPDRMREPTFPGQLVLGDGGDNLPAVLEAVCTDVERKNVLTSWLRELTPMDVRDFEFPRDPSGRIHLQILERKGRKVSAYSASDGTLRFLGMLAALLGPNERGLNFFEEIDNGIHPARLSLLLDLIERQAAMDNVQVVATTHSPGLLELVSDTTFEDISAIYRDENSANAIIRPVAELPEARRLRRSQGLGRLHMAGWIEDVLAFSEAENEDREGGE